MIFTKIFYDDVKFYVRKSFLRRDNKTDFVQSMYTPTDGVYIITVKLLHRPGVRSKFDANISRENN